MTDSIQTELTQGEATAPMSIESAQSESISMDGVDITFDNILSKFSEDGQSTLTKNGVKDFDTLEKSYKGLLELKGKKGIIEPSENASDEEKSVFRESLLDKLGRPEEGKYDFEVKEEIADEYITDDFVGELASLAHKNGINNEGFQSILDHIYGNYAKVVNDFEAFKSTVQDKLGEGSLDDSTKAVKSIDFDAEGTKKLQESIEARRKGDFVSASKLQVEAQEIFAKMKR